MFTQQKMGSPFHLIFYCDDSSKAVPLANASFLLVDSLNNIFSDYLPGSELNRLCATAGKDSFVTVSDPLYEIFLAAEEASKNTKGNFDVTIGPLSRVWRKARREKSFPHRDTIKKAKEKVDWRNVVIDKGSHRVKLCTRKYAAGPGRYCCWVYRTRNRCFLKTQKLYQRWLMQRRYSLHNAPPINRLDIVLSTRRSNSGGKNLTINCQFIRECSSIS